MKLNVFFSSVHISVPSRRLTDLMRPNVGETILENLYGDTDQNDVVFTFDSPIELPFTGEQFETISNSVSI